ncbi:MAG: hypothetical protein EOP83_14615 [Verrucomicrobiaceae bacterium]|nr:MAG: hypothetical protein EOP83_14615 [Verrucomicrobiaceae bacterium]
MPKLAAFAIWGVVLFVIFLVWMMIAAIQRDNAAFQAQPPAKRVIVKCPAGHVIVEGYNGDRKRIFVCVTGAEAVGEEVE